MLVWRQIWGKHGNENRTKKEKQLCKQLICLGNNTTLTNELTENIKLNKSSLNKINEIQNEIYYISTWICDCFYLNWIFKCTYYWKIDLRIFWV